MKLDLSHLRLDDAAQRVGRAVEDRVRVVVVNELRQQMRPGGLLRDGY